MPSGASKLILIKASRTLWLLVLPAFSSPLDQNQTMPQPAAAGPLVTSLLPHVALTSVVYFLEAGISSPSHLQA